jgi:hypothetical protein
LNRRDYSNWIRLSSTTELIKFFVGKIGREYLILRFKNVAKQYRGTYMHIDLAIQFAQWISPEFAYNVSQLVKSHIISKYEEQIVEYKNEITEKNVTINELKAKMDEMLKNSYQIIDDNKKTHQELSNVSKDLKKANNNLDDLTELVFDMSIDTVPTTGWNKFGVFKNDKDKSNIFYKTVRSKKSDYKKNTIKFEGYTPIFEIELPNGIEYFKTFKEKYNDGKKIISSYTTIYLGYGVSEQDLLDLFKKHENRIRTDLEKAIPQ